MRKILTLIFILSANFLFSQVGINTMTPSILTDLDVKNRIVAGDTIPKGILIPRMTLKQRNSINVTDPNAANSLLIYNTDEDCYNYFNRAANEWSSLCGKLGKAQFDVIDCKTVSVQGQYLTKTALSMQNFITLNVKVTKPGSYIIKGLPKPDNGYYFYAAGEFLQIGDFVITIPASGTPLNAKALPGDLVSIVLNDNEVCTVRVVIEDSSIKPLYTMDCGSVSVKGVYRLNTLVGTSHYIDMVLNVDGAAIGSKYIIKTNTVDGLSFSATGLILSSPQSVKLFASGTPTSLNDKLFTITSNSATSVSSCSAKVTVALTPKTILSIGTYAGNALMPAYGYNVSFSGSNSNKLVTTPSNFGLQENSIVKVEGIKFISPGDFSPSLAQLTAALNEKPDIVIMGVWWNPDAARSQLLVDYVAKGGVLLAFMEESGTTTILQTIFGDPTITATASNAAGAVYRLPYLNDEVLNGPFGDIRGKQWGEDASPTMAINNIPGSQVTNYSNGNDISGATTTGAGARTTAFRHNTLNIIFVCDGGFNSGANNAPTADTMCPFNVDATGKPIPKANYGRGATKFPAYNSVFTANALSWALKQAQFNGINSH